MSKFVNAALHETALPDDLYRGLVAICETVPSDGVHKWPEAAADQALGGRYAFPSTGLFQLRSRGLLEIGFGQCWYAILSVRKGRLWVKSAIARPAIPAGVRRAVFARDGRCCVYCGCLSGPFDLDHVIPLSRGGGNSADNISVACASCNRSKSDKTPEEWLQ